MLVPDDVLEHFNKVTDQFQNIYNIDISKEVSFTRELFSAVKRGIYTAETNQSCLSCVNDFSERLSQLTIKDARDNPMFEYYVKEINAHAFTQIENIMLTLEKEQLTGDLAIVKAKAQLRQYELEKENKSLQLELGISRLVKDERSSLKSVFEELQKKQQKSIRPRY